MKGNFFMLHFGATAEHAPRLGVVVGKKLLKQAVRRNTVKRIVRETFRLHRTELPHRDVIVRLMQKFKGVPKQSLAQDLNQLFERWTQQSKARTESGKK